MTGLRRIALSLITTLVLGAGVDAASIRDTQAYWWQRYQASSQSSTQFASVAGLVNWNAAAANQDAGRLSNISPAVAPAPVAVAAAPAPAAAAYQPVSNYQYDGYLNFSDGPFPGSNLLTDGNPRPWYNSPVVQNVYGGTPSPDQQADFVNTVLQRVEQTFALSGVPVTLTATPGSSAAHTMSLVSNTSYPANKDAIGITDVGNDGVSFIDKFQTNNLDQLEWAVAHNMAHELMHTFGGDHHDTTGTYLDGASATWDLLTNPNTVFGPDSVKELLSHDFKQRYDRGGSTSAEELEITPSPVPEPATVLLWSVVGSLVVAGRVRQRRRAA